MAQPMWFSREGVLDNAVLHMVCDALAGFFYRSPAGAWEGDRRSGRYTHDNLQGDMFALAWDEAALVGLIFFHESVHSQYNLDPEEVDPFARLPNLPAACEAAAEAARAWTCDDQVTGGFWICGDEVWTSDGVPGQSLRYEFSGGFCSMDRFRMPWEMTLRGVGDGWAWRHIFSLDEVGATEVAFKLTRLALSGGGPVPSSWLDPLDRARRRDWAALIEALLSLNLVLPRSAR